MESEYAKFLEVNKLLDDADVPTDGRTGRMSLEAYFGYMFTYGTPQEMAKATQTLITQKEQAAYQRGLEAALEALPSRNTSSWTSSMELWYEGHNAAIDQARENIERLKE